MKSLIAFYSRKGTTKKIAELIGKEEQDSSSAFSSVASLLRKKN